MGLQTASPRSRRTVAKSATASGGRGRARRGKGRLSGANHTPQTPSPLSMSPTDARGEAVLPRFNLADAEQITAATLERIRALQSSGDKSSIVTAEQAQQSLELVLRFLSEQPSDFLPANHLWSSATCRPTSNKRSEIRPSRALLPPTVLARNLLYPVPPPMRRRPLPRLATT